MRILASKHDISYQDLLKDMILVFKELDATKSIISIPLRLSDKVKEKIKDTDINTVSEYVAFLLRMILADETEITRLDEENIKRKLKSLGYL